MPSVKKKKKMPETGGIWQRWERFTRHGIKINGRRYTSTQLLQAWALSLAVLYILLLLGRKSRASESSLLTSSDEHFEIDHDFWRGRHLIFCVSPGRSGSKYLRNIFAVANNVVARHEPEPKMNGDVLKQVVIQGKRAETFEQRARIKLSAIREALDGTSPDVVYVETSHMFIKTFCDVIVGKLGDLAKISVVFLRRPMKDTVLSQLQLGWFSEGHSGRDSWYYDASRVHVSEQQISFQTNASNAVELLIAYNVDVLHRGVELEREIRKRHKQKEWRRVNMFETLLLDLTGDAANAGVLRLLSSIGLKADEEKLSLLHEQDHNARDVKKERVKVDVTAEQVARKLEDMKNKVPMLAQDMY